MGFDDYKSVNLLFVYCMFVYVLFIGVLCNTVTNSVYVYCCNIMLSSSSPVLAKIIVYRVANH